MRLGYGLITCQRYPGDPRSDADIYREAVELAVLAERNGFESVWTSEHHFVDDGYMPSVLVASAAIAQATERIGIGTGILLAPLHHPLRIAEDAATVDCISGGRLILGLGAGWRDEEFELLGSDIGRRPSRMRETVATLREAFGPASNVTPKPVRPVPIWMGGFVDAAVRRAGRIADGFIGSSSGTSGIEAFARFREIALSEAGGRPFSFALHVPVYVGAWDEIREPYWYLRWKYDDMRTAHGRAPSEPLPSPPPLTDEIEQRLRPTIICGSADEVAAQIGAYRRALGDETLFICRSYIPGLRYDLQRRTIELLGERVLPALS